MKLGQKKDVLLGITPYIKYLILQKPGLKLSSHYTLNKDKAENSLYFIQLSYRGTNLYSKTTKLHPSDNNRIVTSELTKLLEALLPTKRLRALAIKELELQD
jgi:hypothetical protein